MKNGQISLQASAFLLSVTNTLVLTNTLTYYGIRRLQICYVFIVQALGTLVCSDPGRAEACLVNEPLAEAEL
jgi:hypothetical protein